MSLNSKNIIITGATGHLGEAVAAQMAGPEVHICLCHRNSEERADQLKKRLEPSFGSVVIVKADLSHQAGAQSAISQALELMGGLNTLVHLTSSFVRTPFGSIDEQTFRNIIDVNLSSAFFIAQAAANAMHGSGGSIVFLTDIAARRPYGSYLPYSIAKAGVEALTRGLAKTLAPMVRVNALAPYLVREPMEVHHEERLKLVDATPMKRQTDPAEIASLVRWLSFDAHTTTGQILSIDSGTLLR
jgi:pteridine reductase